MLLLERAISNKIDFDEIPTESLTDVADDLVSIRNEGRRPQLEIPLEGLLSQPADGGLAILTRDLEPIASNPTAK